MDACINQDGIAYSIIFVAVRMDVKKKIQVIFIKKRTTREHNIHSNSINSSVYAWLGDRILERMET